MGSSMTKKYEDEEARVGKLWLYNLTGRNYRN